MRPEQNNKYNLDRLRNWYSDQEARRHSGAPRQEDDFDKGREVGAHWATDYANPEVLSLLKCLKGKHVTSSGFLYMALVRQMRIARMPMYSLAEIFGPFLADGVHHDSDYLEGFVYGALGVWHQFMAERRQFEQEQPAKKQNKGAPAAAWLGWYRASHKSAWLMIVEGQTELEVVEKLVHMSGGGDTICLPAGQHPDSLNNR